MNQKIDDYEFKYCVMKETDPNSGPAERSWDIHSKKNFLLGSVAWLASWRRYVFVPANNVMFEEQCLRDIAQFIESATKEHKRILKEKVS